MTCRDFSPIRWPWLLVVLLTSGCGDSRASSPVWSQAFDGTSIGWLMNVWGTSGQDRWVAGGPRDSGVLMHRDDSAWSQVELADTPPLLNWIYGFGTDDVTAVGNDGYVAHFDGLTWQQQPTPTVQHLWGVWGARPDSLWAVGGTGRAAGGVPTVLYYDGVDWSEVALPAIQRTGVYAFFKVWGSDENDIYVVGQQGVVLRYDGVTWNELFVGAGDDLIAVWGTGRDRVVLVGGRANGWISTWDGSVWRSQSVSPLPGLNGVWMRDPSSVHLAGVRGTLATMDFDTFTIELDRAPTTDMDFHAVFGTDDGVLTAVGGNLASPSAPWQGIAYERTLLEDE
ncbi:MAG: hypothetical protein R3C68_06805 [Myxococcota bacterium]